MVAELSHSALLRRELTDLESRSDSLGRGCVPFVKRRQPTQGSQGEHLVSPECLLLLALDASAVALLHPAPLALPYVSVACARRRERQAVSCG